MGFAGSRCGIKSGRALLLMRVMDVDGDDKGDGDDLL